MTSTAAPTPARAPFWEDAVDIFVSPSQVFARRMGRGFGLALLVVTLVSTALFIGTKPLMEPVMDAEFTRQAAHAMAANPGITQAQIDRQRAFGEKIGFLLPLIGIPVSVMLVGIVSWVVGKIFDSQQTAGDALMVATWAYFPRILAFAVAALFAAFSDPSSLTGAASVSLSAARFANPDVTRPAILALLARLDLFVLWSTVLIGLGLHVTGKIPKARALGAAAIVWVLGALPSVLPALMR